MVDDTRLVARMLAGEEAGFDEFFERFFPALFRFALARLDGDADAAEDVVQATLCRAIDKLRTYRGEAALLTWLCTICRHGISDYRNRQPAPSKADPIEDSPEIRAALESLSAWDSSRPDLAFERREIARLVQVTLDSLPGRYGDALEWKYIHGLSVKEIADRLVLGPKAAESLLTRARHAFREGFRTVCQRTANANPVVSWDGLEP